MRSSLVIAFLLAIASLAPATPEDDAYLRGYIVSWLRHAHRIEPEQVQVKVEDGTVTLTGTVESADQAEELVASVASFQGVEDVVSRLTVAPAGGRETAAEPRKREPSRWAIWTRWLRPPPGRKVVYFPEGDLFVPPLADQKQPRFHTTWQHWRTAFGRFDVASVGFGENFGLVRVPREREGDGLQIGISGAVFSIFNLDSESLDLLNSDFIIGFPISFRRGPASARLRVFHQSSHLGDEFLLNPQPVPPVERINLSYEAVELLGSWERRGYRVYGGGMQIFATDTPLGRTRLQAGFEYRGSPKFWRHARLVSALDVEAWEETDWDRDWSAKAGFLFRSPYGEARSLQVLLEYFNGHAPHGQFFPLEVRYFGLGIAYAF